MRAEEKARRVVTISRSHTIVPTYECFNRCTYCNFRMDRGESPVLTVEEASEIFRDLVEKGEGDEVLILSGEVHPKSRRRVQWLDHIIKLCEKAMEFGLLPHTNAGPLSYEEMKRLGEVNASMGLMLEQITPSLTKTVHKFAPSKDPSLRIEQLRMAGKLQIPFTTGILLGIGETPEDRVESLEMIATIAREYGHIQECIIQPFSSGDRDKWQHSMDPSAAFETSQLPALVQKARQILPENVAVQIPPNLVSSGEGGANLLLDCIQAGASDLGGVSPLDEVNPTYPFPKFEDLHNLLDTQGFQLEHRLCVHESRTEMLKGMEGREEIHSLVEKRLARLH
uniref:7,8-didemethyl-8-hydroxy-5-deazariboflavin synthase n=1 Tax=Amorphochlora amoebiformis TaxID=1561963 RepID=A0A7S0DN93_9EUKA